MNKIIVYSFFVTLIACNQDYETKSNMKYYSCLTYDFYSNKELEDKRPLDTLKDYFKFRNDSEILFFHKGNPFLKFTKKGQRLFNLNFYNQEKSKWFESNNLILQSEKDFYYIKYRKLEESYYFFKVDKKLNIKSLILVGRVLQSEDRDDDYCIQPYRYFSFEKSNNQIILQEHKRPKIDMNCTLEVLDGSFYFEKCEKLSPPIKDTINMYKGYESSLEVFEQIIIDHDI